MGNSVKDDSATVSGGSTTKTDSDTVTETDEECRSVRESQPFEEGEWVFVRNKYDHKFYDAKVLKRDLKNEKWAYYIHYHGWKKRYDEWVGAECLVKNLTGEPQKQMVSKKKSDVEKNVKPGDMSPIGRGKKRKNDTLDKEKSDVPSEVVRLQIPLSLEEQLIKDYEHINHLGKLVTLPRNPTVDLILKKYLDYRSQKSDNISKSVEEIMCGLRSYFDKGLQMMLLYKKERHQFANAIGKKMPPSKVYGAEHLLRLCVKLPELLARANIEGETFVELRVVVSDLLKFLHENQKDYFQQSYFFLADAETSTNN